MDRITTSRIQSTKRPGNSFVCPSAQSFLSRTEIKSDPLFYRAPKPTARQIRTAQPLKAEPDAMPNIQSATPTLQRSLTQKQISLERINRLAQPKSLRVKTTANPEHVRSNLNEETAKTAEDLFGKIENTSEVITRIENIPIEKPKSAADDHRFRHLVGVFSEVYAARKPISKSVRSIVQANPSLQDEEGQWKSGRNSAISRKAEIERHHKALADKLNKRLDVFLIDVGA